MHAGGNGTWYGQMGEDARKKIKDFVIINRMDISRGNGKEISVVLTVLESYGIVSPCLRVILNSLKVVRHLDFALNIGFSKLVENYKAI
jgi:hypothetical protein